MASTRTRTRPLRSGEGERAGLDHHPLGTESRHEREQVRRPSRPQVTLDWRQAVGGGLIAFGMVAVIIGWFGVSGTLEPGEQMPYISSGGFGGAALIAIGVTLIVSYEHVRDRDALRQVLDELDELRARLDALAPPDAVTNVSANGPS